MHANCFLDIFSPTCIGWTCSLDICKLHFNTRIAFQVSQVYFFGTDVHMCGLSLVNSAAVCYVLDTPPVSDSSYKAQTHLRAYFTVICEL